MKETHAPIAFSGEGAAKFGGRWNSRGVKMVYTSSTQSLAVLETLVHLNPPMDLRYVTFELTLDESGVTPLELGTLPRDWRQAPPSPGTQSLGDRWVQSNSSVVLAVPSVVVPGEKNYLLNPAHPGFSKIRISQPTPFALDARLLT